LLTVWTTRDDWTVGFALPLCRRKKNVEIQNCEAYRPAFHNPANSYPLISARATIFM